ncbi:MAG TPA: PEGA domain-containing protein [Candidatus Brocadiaceae bacterium]
MKHKMYWCFALIMAIGLFMAGCASVIKGTSQTVTFDSNPEGAKVMIDGRPFGVTPLSVSLAKNKYSNITFEKEGYKSRSMVLGKQFDAIALINIFWDLSTTDLITGAIYEYSPNQYYVDLKKVGSD